MIKITNWFSLPLSPSLPYLSYNIRSYWIPNTFPFIWSSSPSTNNHQTSSHHNSYHLTHILHCASFLCIDAGSHQHYGTGAPLPPGTGVATGKLGLSKIKNYKPGDGPYVHGDPTTRPSNPPKDTVTTPMGIIFACTLGGLIQYGIMKKQKRLDEMGI